MHRIEIRRDKRALGYPQAARLLRHAVRKALDAQGVTEQCQISVLFTDDAGIRRINRELRHLDAATDVLSFPMSQQREGQFDPALCPRDWESGALALGDMVLSLERCASQGMRYGHGFARELSYLTVHSVLHLLGYDHLDEGPRKRAMREREKAVMARLWPYGPGKE